MEIDRLDHLNLTVSNVERTCDFYGRVLGMKVVSFGAGRTSLNFGRQKINLEQGPAESRPGEHLCFITTTPIDAVLAQLAAAGVAVEQGPAPRAGATGEIQSVYLRDPDRNLIEIATY
jgi:catechol 2,3-dioxygenase-like lactoylglutathione lyase family enzyme